MSAMAKLFRLPTQLGRTLIVPTTTRLGFLSGDSEKPSAGTINVYCRDLSTSANMSSSSKLYELRMYTIQPQHFKPTLDLFEKHCQLRLQYSKLFGYWTAEIGGGTPTQFVHIWEYDSLSQRQQVRNSLAGDDEWKTKFFSTLLKNLDTWTNALMVSSSDTEINVDFGRKDSAVYLLQTLTGTKVQGQSENEGKGHGGHLVGKFEGILGQTNVEYFLWRFENVDDAAVCAKERANDNDGTMMLLHPTPFSPIH